MSEASLVQVVEFFQVSSSLTTQWCVRRHLAPVVDSHSTCQLFGAQSSNSAVIQQVTANSTLRGLQGACRHIIPLIIASYRNGQS